MRHPPKRFFHHQLHPSKATRVHLGNTDAAPIHIYVGQLWQPSQGIQACRCYPAAILQVEVLQTMQGPQCCNARIGQPSTVLQQEGLQARACFDQCRQHRIRQRLVDSHGSHVQFFPAVCACRTMLPLKSSKTSGNPCSACSDSAVALGTCASCTWRSWRHTRSSRAMPMSVTFSQLTKPSRCSEVNGSSRHKSPSVNTLQ